MTKESNRDRRFGYFVFGGAVIGALLGIMVTAGGGHAVVGLVIGGLVGLAIGWFAGAARMEQEKPAAKKSKE